MYLFSDGYADQFGGVKNKKLKKKEFYKLLESSFIHPIDKQKKHFISFHQIWKNNNPQTDDILLIGLDLKTLR